MSANKKRSNLLLKIVNYVKKFYKIGHKSVSLVGGKRQRLDAIQGQLYKSFYGIIYSSIVAAFAKNITDLQLMLL
jgi:hypothetical protein